MTVHRAGVRRRGGRAVGTCYLVHLTPGRTLGHRADPGRAWISSPHRTIRHTLLCECHSLSPGDVQQRVLSERGALRQTSQDRAPRQISRLRCTRSRSPSQRALRQPVRRVPSHGRARACLFVCGSAD